jgi:hypothetical protein
LDFIKYIVKDLFLNFQSKGTVQWQGREIMSGIDRYAFSFLYLPADFLKLFIKDPGPLNYKNIFVHLNNFSCILVLLT